MTLVFASFPALRAVEVPEKSLMDSPRYKWLLSPGGAAASGIARRLHLRVMTVPWIMLLMGRHNLFKRSFSFIRKSIFQNNVCKAQRELHIWKTVIENFQLLLDSFHIDALDGPMNIKTVHALNLNGHYFFIDPNGSANERRMRKTERGSGTEMNENAKLLC